MKANQPSITTTRSRAKAADVPSASAVAAAADFGRQQAIVATESACAVFRGFEAIRKIQEDVAHKAFEKYADAANKLRGPCGPGDVLAVQTDLLSFDTQAATQYWQGIAAAVTEMQAEVMNCASHLVNTEALLESTAAVDAVESKIPGLDAYFSLFPAIRQAALTRYGPRSEV